MIFEENFCRSGLVLRPENGIPQVSMEVVKAAIKIRIPASRQETAHSCYRSRIQRAHRGQYCRYWYHQTSSMSRPRKNPVAANRSRSMSQIAGTVHQQANQRSGDHHRPANSRRIIRRCSLGGLQDAQGQYPHARYLPNCDPGSPQWRLKSRVYCH